MAVHLNHGAMDLVAEDRDLRQVLEEIFMMADVRYDMPPEVRGTVTIRLHNATYEQALHLVLGHVFTYTIGPHDTIYVHRSGTTWRPGG